MPSSLSLYVLAMLRVRKTSPSLFWKTNVSETRESEQPSQTTAPKAWVLVDFRDYFAVYLVELGGSPVLHSDLRSKSRGHG